jgi:hypothetical protein
VLSLIIPAKKGCSVKITDFGLKARVDYSSPLVVYNYNNFYQAMPSGGSYTVKFNSF